MSILETIMFYAVSCSAVFMYGIGMERSFLDSGKDIAFFLRIPAMLVLSLGSFIVLWYPVSVFLVPFNLSYLVPVLTVTIGVLMQIGLSLTGYTEKPVPGEERVFYFGIVLLALFEGTSFLTGILVVLSGILSWVLVTILLFSIRGRISPSRIPYAWKGAPISLVSLGLLSLAFYAPDISWWVLP